MKIEKVYLCEPCNIKWPEEDLGDIANPSCVICGNEKMMVGRRFSGDGHEDIALKYIENLLENPNQGNSKRNNSS